MSSSNLLRILSRFNKDYNPLITSRRSRPTAKQETCEVPSNYNFLQVPLLMGVTAFLIVVTSSKWKLWTKQFEKSSNPLISSKHPMEARHEDTSDCRPFYLPYSGISDEQEQLELSLESGHHFWTLKEKCDKCGRTDLKKLAEKVKFLIQLLKDARKCPACAEARKADKGVQTEPEEVCLQGGLNSKPEHDCKDQPRSSRSAEFRIPLSAAASTPDDSSRLSGRKVNLEIEFNRKIRLV